VSDDRVARFVEAVKADPRVLGLTQRAPGRDSMVRLILVTTWDGTESLPRDLAAICACLLPDGPRVEQTYDDEGKIAWTGLGADGTRAAVTLRRAADLRPDAACVGDVVLYDPRGIVVQWIRCSDGATDERPVDASRQRTALILGADAMVRRDERVPRAGDHFLRRARASLALDDPVESLLATRIDRSLQIQPGRGEGTRALPGEDPVAQFESFLTVADGEGFKGDRVLFGETVTRLRDLAKREPVFDQGFVVPTFDAVEAGFALGEAVGGCQPPLIPGVYVGVGVTPKDALEFWAAPFVRDPTCSVACVDDTGERDVVLRAAGRDPMVATLTSVVDAAFDRLPALIDRARDATKESVDPSAALAALHLPRSFFERAKRRGADALMCSRLTVALAVARAGHDCAPLVARKFGLAAGRVLASR
jgi:hypothetical protein